MIVNAFNDVPDYNIQTNVTYGKDTLNVAAMNVGFGNTCFKSDDQGIWLGAEKFATAPFRVNMAGALVATSATISGYASDTDLSTLEGTVTDLSGDLTDLSGNALVKDSITQILAGKIIVGDSKITIDGVNKRIIINDGTYDRILIGYQSGGF